MIPLFFVIMLICHLLEFISLNLIFFICFVADCAAVPDMLTLTSNPLTCNLDNTCNRVSCCINSAFTNSTFEVVFDLNRCTRMLTIGIENLKAQIPYSEIQWG